MRAFALGLLWVVGGAWAEEPGTSVAPPVTAAPTSAADAPASVPSASPKKGKTGHGAQKKEAAPREADGTEALDRFEAETVLKSKYHLNGEPLEVDPD